MSAQSSPLKRQQYIADFFEQLMQEGAQNSETWAAKGIRRVEAGFVFNLPSLHQAIAGLQGISYTAFKEALYVGQLNKALAEKGLLVELYKQTEKPKRGKLDSNLYCLKALV